MRPRPLARIIASVTVSAAAVLVMSGPAGADATYHSGHIPLHAVANAPLRSGFVENIHANGPNVFAHEVYVVNGALQNTTFQVSIAISRDDPSCTVAPISFDTATLETNGAGNAKAEVFFTPADAGDLRDATHGAIWTLSVGGVPIYQTDCTEIDLD